MPCAGVIGQGFAESLRGYGARCYLLLTHGSEQGPRVWALHPGWVQDDAGLWS